MITPTVSVIIPSRNETFLQKTVKDILKKSVGAIEVITVLEGYWPDPPLPNDNRLVVLHHSQPKGMREAINAGAALARGKYLMKCDAHCMFMEGFDAVLSTDCDDNWVVIPRRHRLDAENWCIQEEKHKPPIDYEFLSSPGHYDRNGNKWTVRTLERINNPKYLIDENMIFQGSCWLMNKKHYDNFLNGLDGTGYGTFIREAYEIGLKTWLGGGRVMTNKKAWYAHLHKGTRYGRMYLLNKREIDKGIAYSDDLWYNNRWKGAKHDLAWLVEKFMPVPSWTPELIEKVRKKNA